MKQNERFDEVLNLCIDRVLKGEPVEQCLCDYPEQAAELEPLLHTALAAKAASAVQPRSEFRARARYEFQAALQEMKAAKKRSNPFFQWRWQWQSAWSLALLVLVFILVAGSGTVVAARNSMPDNPLYSVKIFSENVQLTFARSDEGKTELNARFAERRADEIVYAAANNKTQDVRTAASGLNSNVSNIAGITETKLAAANQSNALRNSNSRANSQESATQSLNLAPPAVTNQDIAAPMAAPAAAPAAGLKSAPIPGPVSTQGAGSGGVVEPALPPDNTPASEPAPPSAGAVPAPVIAVPPEADSTLAPVAAPAVRGFAPPLPTKDDAGLTESTATVPTILVRSYGLGSGNASVSQDSEQERLRQVIVTNYNTLISRLEEALKVASPDVRQIIRQAITQAQAEYDKALKNLELAEIANQQN